MNPVKAACSAKNLTKISSLFDLAKGNGTMRELFEKLDGCNANDAYVVLKNLSDYELKVMAAFIAEANTKFDRKKG